MNLNINQVFKYILPFMYSLTVCYVIGVVLFLLLPKEGIEYDKVNPLGIKQMQYPFMRAFNLKPDSSGLNHTQNANKNYQLVSNVSLNAIYFNPKGKSWIVVSEKTGSKTHILSVEDTFKQFRLTRIFKDYVIFEKLNKKYKLEMKIKKVNYTVTE